MASSFAAGDVVQLQAEAGSKQEEFDGLKATVLVVEGDGQLQLRVLEGAGMAGSSVRWPQEAARLVWDASSSLESMKLAPAVDKAIDELWPSDDPLDAPDFDPLAYINERFPDQSALAEVGGELVGLRKKLVRVDAELSEAVREQSRSGMQAAVDIVEAKNAIQQLFGKIKDIKAKSEQSEVMVEQICKDIRALDYAKKNLTKTIKAMKQLQMLTSAVDTLQALHEERQYEQAAELLLAVSSLYTHFDAYEAVPRIRNVRERVGNIRHELEKQVLKDFSAISDLSEEELDSPLDDRVTPELLNAACSVISSLGSRAREGLIKDFCEAQMAYFSRKHTPDGKMALEEIDSRLAWFRDVYKAFTLHLDIVFPAHWEVLRRLCLDFCDALRAQLTARLSDFDASAESVDVTGMLRALQRSLSFEREMAMKLERDSPSKAAAAVAEEEDVLELDEHGNVLDPSSAEYVKRKHRRRMDAATVAKRFVAAEASSREAAERAAKTRAMAKEGSMEDEKMPELPPLAGRLSSAFMPYMGAYVAYEEQQMTELIERGRPEERLEREVGTEPVFSSSLDLFMYIKNSTKRCTMLSTGDAFFQLYSAFKRGLQLYSNVLTSKLPRPQSIASFGGIEGYRLAAGAEMSVCYVMNTAGYCLDTLEQLEGMLRGKIDADFKERISFEEEEDAFSDAQAAARAVLISGLELRMEASLIAMTKTNWSAVADVGDQSPYVLDMHRVLQEFTPTLRDMLSHAVFVTFCGQFVKSFLPHFRHFLYKCKKISEFASQQLLLDTHALKTMLLNMQSIGLDEAIEPSATFVKVVNKEMSSAEKLLKLVGTDPERLVDSLQVLWPEATGSDFQRVMDMKGMKKSEQAPLLAAVQALGMSIERRRPDFMEMAASVFKS
eukprot:PLAT12242.1.p1 GENE.PLAT12242.1~~PLAT12242.1.p1  ORF type:complete len:894 (-),score=458.83 PLAT12242.1:72-2753(-)